ncbi:MAG: LacI family DNA-binding transcriptional regulator [Clostridia bacterium]|nr:LacI family DNA-binding transcriptional regulator [Clostridia bacterium]
MPRKSTVPTRKDVAELAGVSETIVSYVLNANRYVSADKKKRVLEAVEKLHYRPNSIARALKGKGNSHILFIADNVANDYFGHLLQEMDSIAYDKGYLVSLMSVKNDQDFVTRILSRQVDAVIISSASLAENYIQQLVDNGLPVVLLMTRDYATVRGRVARIYTGIESGIMAAVRLLHERGCRHLVHVDRISRHQHFSSRQDLRFRGFCNQMEALGLSLSADSFITGCADYDELFNAVCRRIQSGVPVDGFVCRNDGLACTVLSAVQACGKKVPEEISVIGFDNSDTSRVIRPALSTVAMDQKAIAQSCLELIEAMVNGQEPQEKHLVTQMVLRDTTR